MKEKFTKTVIAVALIVGCFGWFAAERPDLLHRIVAAQSDETEDPRTQAARAGVASAKAIERKEPTKPNAIAVDEAYAVLNRLLEGSSVRLRSDFLPASGARP